MTESESVALPFGDSAMRQKLTASEIIIKFPKKCKHFSYHARKAVPPIKLARTRRVSPGRPGIPPEKKKTQILHNSHMKKTLQTGKIFVRLLVAMIGGHIMRKTVLVIFASLLSLALFACGGSEDKKETKSVKEQREEARQASLNAIKDEYPGVFRVGFDRQDIIPDESVPMAGYGNESERWSTGYKDTPYVHAVAITDANDETMLILNFDFISCNSTTGDMVINAILEKCPKLNKENILIQGTHTHAGPAVSNGGYASIVRFRQKAAAQAAKAVVNALNDRHPATMFVGSTEADRMNFTRHWELEDGTYAGNNFGGSGVTKAFEDAPDNNVRLLTFKREDAKDLIMCFWQAHPTFLNRVTYDISSDAAGRFREEVMAHYNNEVDCLWIQGPAGEQNCSSHIEGDEGYRAEEEEEKYYAYAKAFAQYTIDIYDNKLVQIPTGAVKIKWIPAYDAPVNHTEDSKAAGASLVQAEWKKSYDQGKATAIGQPYGINSPYHANGILSKFAMGQTYEIKGAGVAQIGESLALMIYPFEAFHVGLQQVRNDSPYEYTYSFCYANNHYGYLPMAVNYEHDCYEINTCPFAKGTAEDLNNKVLTYLEILKYGDESILKVEQ